MRADDFLDGSSSADAFLDGAAATPQPKAAPSLTDRVYSTLNKLFREPSVMDGALATGREFDPVATAKLDRTINQPTARALPEAAPSVGIMEKGVRGGVAQLAKSGLGLVQGAADAVNLPTVADIAAGAARRADKFGSNPLQAGRIDGFTQNSIVQDLPKAGAGAISSVIGNLPALAANVVAPGSGLPVMFGQVAASEYGEGRADGLTGIGALLRSLPMAGAEVLGEKLGGFNPLTQGIRRAIDEGSIAPMARAMLASSAREIPSELATTAAQFGIDKLPGVGLKQEATMGDLAGQLKDTALQTALQAGSMGAVGSTMQGNQPAPIAPTGMPISAPVEQPAAPSAEAFLDEVAPPEAIQPEAQPDIRIPTSEQNQPLTEATNEQARQPDVLVNDPQPVLPASDGVGVATPAETALPQATEVSQTATTTTSNDAGSSVVAATSQQPLATPELPAPAQINGEQASQVTTASPGMRPGDIVDATGKPFATPQQAKNHAKAAGPGWTVKKGQGGHVVRYQPPSEKQIANGKRQAKNAASIDTSRDSLFAAIAKLGGVSETALTKEWGFDPSEFKNLRVGIKPLMRKAGGMTLDGMAQRLAELGYISQDENGQFDQAEMYDLFDGELRGNKHFTPAGFENNAQAQKDAEYDAWVKEQDAADLDSLPDDLQNHIEEYLDDHDAIVPDEEASIEAQSKRGLATTDGEIDRIPGFEKEGDRPAAETDQPAQDGANPEERTAAAAQSTEVDNFDLAGETLDQGKARTARDAAQAKSTEQQNKRADQKAQADSERDSFTLTGSNRTADVAASQGQQSFDDVPFSRSGNAKTLADVRAAWDAAGIKNAVFENGDTINLSQIIVPKDGRNDGAGTRAMQALIDYADQAGKRITLTPSADFGGNKNRLVDFYKRFGFIENKGRNKDFTTMESMYRPAPESDFSRSGDDGSDIPATYFQNTQVAHDVWITDEARFDTAEVSAQDAIDSVREDRDNYKRLLDCMRG